MIKKKTHFIAFYLDLSRMDPQKRLLRSEKREHKIINFAILDKPIPKTKQKTNNTYKKNKGI